MALATDITAGEIQLTGDLAGDGGAQVGSSPQLTHISGLTPGQYINSKLTVDAKGRITTIQTATGGEIAAGLPVATASVKGVVSIGANLNITTGTTNGYQEVDMGSVAVGGDASGLDSCATFTVDIQVDGGTVYTVSNTGAVLLTIQDVIDEINTDTTGVTAAVVGGNINIESDTLGRASTITISNDTLFKCLTGYVQIDPAVQGTADCELSVPEATVSSKGVVQIGTGIDVTGGIISVDLGTLPIATAANLGGVIVPTANGLSVDVAGSVSIDLATESSVGVMQVGNGLDVDGNGIVSVDLNEVVYADATEVSKGIMQVGNGLDVTAGVVSVDLGEVVYNDATESVKGIMQVGNGLDVTAGLVSVDETELADATVSSKGVVQIGTNINVSAGVISAVDSNGATPGVILAGTGITATAGDLSLDIASGSALGGIIVGTGLTIDGGGTLSADPIPDATYVSKGLIQVTSGSGLDLTAGVLSGEDATISDKGVVQIGTNINVAAGVISVDTADNTTLGLSKSADTNNITITAGAIDVGTDIAIKTVSNSFSKSQSVTPVVLTAGTNVAVDASLSNIFEITLVGNSTLSNPSNLSAGQTFLFKIKQSVGGGNTISFDTVYKFRQGDSPLLSTAANTIDLMSCVSDGTNMYCSYNRNFS